jgi:hypothetical protein
MEVNIDKMSEKKKIEKNPAMNISACNYSCVLITSVLTSQGKREITTNASFES